MLNQREGRLLDHQHSQMRLDWQISAPAEVTLIPGNEVICASLNRRRQDRHIFGRQHNARRNAGAGNIRHQIRLLQKTLKA